MSDKPRDRILGHGHEADGIEEYDNPLPTWWLGLLFVTIIFAVVYSVDYHFVSKRSQTAEYHAEIAAAEARWPQKEVTLAVTADAVEEGKEVYGQMCAGCHGADLKGGIGPNLADGDWLHGGTLESINATIAAGVQAKGMPAWGPVLGPSKVAQVAAFVHESGGGK